MSEFIDSIDWNKDIWTVIESYFNNTDNYLAKDQLDSYNTFLKDNIPKTVRQFNPIVLPYSLKSEDLDEYLFELKVTLGGSIDEEGNINNDGSGIYIGKPIIQEMDYKKNFIEVNQKTLYPNEARLKNLTYKTEIQIDVIIEMIVNDGNNAAPEIKFFEKVPLGFIPIMLQSKICSLHGLKGNALRIAGECEYDQGGYFIIDGKEKVIVSQERQIENKIYVNDVAKKDDKFKIISEIRSAPEHKFQPARITKVFIYKEKKTSKGFIKENTIRVSIPQINKEIPLSLVFRALGINSDKQIVKTILNIPKDKFSKFISEFLRPTIIEGHIINNQRDALDYLSRNISNRFLSEGTKESIRYKFLIDVLRNHFLPHCGTNLLDKAYFLGHMVLKSIKVCIKMIKPTDRDSFLYKRVDISGFLISAIFRDLYFRVKNRLIEVLNVAYSKKNTDSDGYWKKNIQDESGKLTYNFYKFIGDSNNGIIDIHNVIDRSIVDEGFIYAFKNCWGLKNAPCKQGIVQDINRISYLGFISHLRRINTPLSSSAKIRAPHSLHGSSWGIMCPSETPDGANIGVRKNLAIMSNISFGTNSKVLERLLFGYGVEDIKQINSDKNEGIKVFLNERLIGNTFCPAQLYTLLKLFKRNALINIYTSIAWYKIDNIIKISTDSGRGVRPVFIVENKKIKLTRKILDDIKDSNNPLNWNHLVGGFLNSSQKKPFNYSDPNFHSKKIELLNADSIDDLIEILKTNSGIVEYIDSEESNTSLIAVNHIDITSSHDHYNYCEIHPSLILSVLGNAIPGLSMNQAPRNQFSTSQTKQALGIYASNYRNRMDNKGQILHYTQRAIVKSKLSKFINFENLPHGNNAIVAIGCFSGYNQEDSIIFNLDSVNRGLFRSTKFRTYSARDEIESNSSKEVICKPNPTSVLNMKSGNYSKLDQNGIVMENVKVDENDILIGKCVYSGERDSQGESIIYDNSEYVRRGEEGYVDRVYSNFGNDNQRYCKVRVRKDKIPEIGDKFASRHGQKGTVGMLIPSRDLPRTREGIVPDMIVNTHAFPSRMTIGQFFEVLLGKSCLELGISAEVSPFAEIDIDMIKDILEGLGCHNSGKEILYSGISGQVLHVDFFIGPTYYQRLTHQVSDKQQSRTKGSKAALTKQPVGGRALGGGGRIGEMERDAILSHGASAFLRESFMERSDKYQFWISTKTGIISAVNPRKKIFRDLSSDSSTQFVDSNNNLLKKQTETTNSEFVLVEAPYAFKLLIQEIECLSISPRLIPESVLNEWQKLENINPEKPIITLTDKFIKNSIGDSYYVSKGSKITLPLRAYHNRIKEILLKGARGKKKSLVDFSCGRGGDLFKWQKAGYNNILAIDISIGNIETSDSIDGAKKRYTDMKQSENTYRRQWANSSDIKFIVGDSSKDLLSLDMVNSVKTSSEHKQINRDILNNYIGNLSKNKASCSVMFYAIHYLFDNFKNISQLFINGSNTTVKGGYFLVTTLDGAEVFQKLKQNNYKLEGKLRDELLWSITGSTQLKSNSLDYLPSDIENGFNHKISVFVESIGQAFDEYLVHPTLLITIANMYGFTLANANEVKEKFKNGMRKATDLFKNLYNSYIKVNSDDEIVELLNSDELKELKKYSDLHRYFIFKKTSEIDELSTGYSDILDSENCNQIIRKSQFDKRYKQIKMPFRAALDPYLIYRDISIPRSYLANSFSLREPVLNDLQKNKGTINNKLQYLVTDIDEKLKSSVFENITDSVFINTMKYIYYNIKSGIFVKIVNGQLYQFTPIVNNLYLQSYLRRSNDTTETNTDIKFLTELEREIIDTYESGETDFYTILSLQSSTENQVNIKEYIDTKYSVNKDTLNFSKWNKLEQSENEKGEDIVLDYCTLSMGKSSILKMIPKYFIYKHMFEGFIRDKKDNLADAEFVINIKDSPIVRYNQEQDCLVSPDILGLQLRHIKPKLLPILSSNSCSDYEDFVIPDYLTYLNTTNIHYPVIDSEKRLFCAKQEFEIGFSPSGPENKLLSLINYYGCGIKSSHNLRIDFLNSSSKISEQLKLNGCELVIKPVTDNINTVLPNIIDPSNARIDSVTNLGLFDKFIPDYMINGEYHPQFNLEPDFYKGLLYIDGVGSDYLLTKLLTMETPIIIVRNELEHRLWYEKLFISYNIDNIDDPNNENANVIIINSLDKIQDAWNVLKNSDTNLMLKNNIINLKETIFNRDNINNYLETLVNKISVKYSINSIKSIADNTIENTTSVNMYVREDLIGLIIGKNGSNLNKIKILTETEISIDSKNSETTRDYTEFLKEQLITIRGGQSGVSIAYKMLEKYVDSSIYYYVLTTEQLYGGPSVLTKNKLINKINQISKKSEVHIFSNISIPELKGLNLTELKTSWKKISSGEDTIIKIIGDKDDIVDAIKRIDNILAGRNMDDDIKGKTQPGTPLFEVDNMDYKRPGYASEMAVYSGLEGFGSFEGFSTVEDFGSMQPLATVEGFSSVEGFDSFDDASANPFQTGPLSPVFQIGQDTSPEYTRQDDEFTSMPPSPDYLPFGEDELKRHVIIIPEINVTPEKMLEDSDNVEQTPFEAYISTLKDLLDSYGVKNKGKVIFEIIVVGDILTQVIDDKELDSDSPSFNILVKNLITNKADYIGDYYESKIICSSHALLYNIGKSIVKSTPEHNITNVFYMQPYILPNENIIDLMNNPIEVASIVNYSTNLIDFGTKDNDLVGILGINYLNKDKFNLPFLASKKNNISYSIIKLVSENSRLILTNSPVSDEYACDNTNAEYNSTNLLNRDDIVELKLQLDIKYNFSRILDNNFITTSIDKLAKNIYSVRMDSTKIKFLPITNISQDIIIPYLTANVQLKQASKLEFIKNIVKSFIKSYGIKDYTDSSDKIIINNISKNIPNYIIPSVYNLVKEITKNRKSYKDLSNMGIAIKLDNSADKFEIRFNIADGKSYTFKNYADIISIVEPPLVTNVFNYLNIYNLEKLVGLYEDDGLQIDYNEVRQSLGINKLTKPEIDELVRNKNEYLVSNPEHKDIIVEDLIKYLVIWSSQYSDIKFIDLSDKLMLISNNSEIENLELNRLALFYNSKFYKRKQVDDEDESIVIRTKITIDDSRESRDKEATSEVENMYKINIIVPFRNTPVSEGVAKIEGQDRDEHLRRFKEHMGGENGFIEKVSQKLYEKGITNKIDITIVEQSQDDKRFNRGALLNVGYIEQNDYDVFIFHDVDLLPNSNMIDIYATRYYKDDIVHFAAEWSRYSQSRDNYLGGVTLMGKNIFNEINGFPNDYWGWGGEDDEIIRRLKTTYNFNLIQKISITDPYVDLENIKSAKEKRAILKMDQLTLDNVIKNEQRDLHAESWSKNGLSMHRGENTFYTSNTTIEESGIINILTTLDYEKIKPIDADGNPLDDKTIRPDLFKK